MDGWLASHLDDPLSTQPLPPSPKGTLNSPAPPLPPQKKLKIPRRLSTSHLNKRTKGKDPPSPGWNLTGVNPSNASNAFQTRTSIVINGKLSPPTARWNSTSALAWDACVSVCDWVSEWVGGWVNEWVGEWASDWVSEWVSGWVGGWVSEWVDELVGEWVSEWVNEWVSEWASGWDYQDLVRKCWWVDGWRNKCRGVGLVGQGS